MSHPNRRVRFAGWLPSLLLLAAASLLILQWRTAPAPLWTMLGVGALMSAALVLLAPTLRGGSRPTDAAASALAGALPALLDGDGVGAFVLTRDGGIHHPNAAFTRMIGVDADKPASALRIEQVFGAHVADDAERMFAELRANGSCKPFDCMRRCEDGRTRWLTLAGVRLDAGSALIVALDSTERKAVDNLLKWQDRVLRAMVDQVPAFIALVDGRGRLLLHNRYFEHWFAGQNLDQRSILELFGPQAAELDRVLHQPGHDGVTQLPLQLTSPSGELREFEADCLPLALDEGPGAIDGWVLLCVDHTDRTRAMQTLRSANERINRFLAILSHELRNPLTAVRTSCELLQRPNLDPAQNLRARAVIDRQSLQLQRIIDDLLDVARITQGKIQLQREPIELGALLRQLADDFAEAAQSQQLELAVEAATGPLWVSADPVRLRQVLGNLLSNALKSSSLGDRVGLRVASEIGDRVRIEVRDQGKGIAPALIPTLFEPFVQADSWSGKGLGLGLTVVRQMVELHGGKVMAHSAGPGHGACFTVLLPRIAPPVPAAAAAATSLPNAQQRGRVLLLDDEIDSSAALEALLTLEGHEVKCCADGSDALLQIARWQPAVVVCDLGLPAPLSGFDVARMLSERIERPYLIAYSGYGSKDDIIRALAVGFDEHLVKPASPAQLLAAIDRGLATRSSASDTDVPARRRAAGAG